VGTNWQLQYSSYLYIQGTGVAQSVERLAEGWTVRGSSPSRWRDFQTDPGAHQNSYTKGTGSFPGRGLEHLPLSRAEAKESIELYLYSPSGSTWPVLGRILPLPLPLHLYT
jgi:hypothetical protein